MTGLAIVMTGPETTGREMSGLATIGRVMNVRAMTSPALINPAMINLVTTGRVAKTAVGGIAGVNAKIGPEMTGREKIDHAMSGRVKSGRATPCPL